MKKVILSIVLIFVFQNQVSASKPESKMEDEPTPFNSLDEAAVAAIKICQARSRTVEYGGCLYKKGEQFFYTLPATNGAADNFNVDCLISEESFAGIYHTHPSGYKVVGISGNDINVANEMNKVSYVGILETSKSWVTKFVPGYSKTKCPTSGALCGSREKTSQGEFVAPL